MKTILILSTNRADFSHLKLIIKELKKSKKLNVKFCITGGHFDENRGLSANEVFKNILPDYKIKLQLNWNSESKINNFIVSFQKRLRTLIKMIHADYIIILGDRIELLAVVNLKLISNIKIIHFSGGETTEGAIDNYVRNILSVVSDIHFVSGKYFKKNVKKIAINKKYIYNSGDPILELISKTKFKTLSELNKEYGYDFEKNNYILFTFHPETISYLSIKEQFAGIENFLNNTDYNILMTTPNNDNGGNYILKRLKYYSKIKKNINLIEHLGFDNYIGFMKSSLFTMGNSSSLIIESPYLKIPSLLIGNRQKGRPLADSIVNTDYTFENIMKGIEQIKNTNFSYNDLKYEKRETSKCVKRKLERIL